MFEVSALMIDEIRISVYFENELVCGLEWFLSVVFCKYYLIVLLYFLVNFHHSCNIFRFQIGFAIENPS